MKQKHQTRPLAAGPKCIWKWRWDKYHTSNLWPGTKGKLEISLSSFPHLSPMQLFLTITLWPSSLKRGLKWKAKSWPAFRSTVILKNRNRRPSSNSHPTIFNMIFNDIRPTFPWPPKPQSHHLLLWIGVDSSNNGDQHFVMNSILKLMIVRDTLCTKNKRKLFSFSLCVCLCVCNVCLSVCHAHQTSLRCRWGSRRGSRSGTWPTSSWCWLRRGPGRLGGLSSRPCGSTCRWLSRPCWVGLRLTCWQTYAEIDMTIFQPCDLNTRVGLQ